MVTLMAATTNGAEESQAVLRKQAKVTEAQATSTALFAQSGAERSRKDESGPEEESAKRW